MKKKTAVLIVLFLIMALTLSACSLTKPRTKLSSDDFKTRMEAVGLTVEDATGQFEEGTVEIVLIAYNDQYQIEFYEVATSADAEAAFAQNKQNFESLSGVKSTTSLNGSNYNYYSMSTGDRYGVVSRIDNTFIYVDEASENKDAVKTIIKDLGY